MLKAPAPNVKLILRLIHHAGSMPIITDMTCKVHPMILKGKLSKFHNGPIADVNHALKGAATDER